MKKSLLLSVAAISAMAMSAATLSPEAALSRVTASDAGMKFSAASMRLVDTAELNGLKTYYVFSGGLQTLFVSADDVAVPLLGIVENENFSIENMPPQMKWWLSEYSRQIAWASENVKVDSSKRTVKMAGSNSRASRQNISPLCSTKWDQESPYNLLTPKLSGRATYTGCVATSLSQALKYHNYPPKGIGTASYQWRNNGNSQLTLDLSTLTFDWANMLDVYTNSATTEQKNAVATLMEATGYAVDMNYGGDSQGGSGAYTYFLAARLIKHFGVDGACNVDYADFYSEADWAEKVYQNLVNVGPVVYDGVTKNNEGHSFIVDGYSVSDDMFHLNWGWSGQDDGYFKLTALDPENQGIGGSSSNSAFNYDQDAVFGIQAPKSGSVAAQAWLAVMGNLSATASGRNVTFTTSDGGRVLWNGSSFDGVISVRVQLTNVNTGAVTDCPNMLTSIEWPAASAYTTRTYTFPNSIGNGTYEARLMYSVDNKTWSPVRTYYGAPQYVLLEVDGSSIGILDNLGVDDVEVTDFSTSTGFHAGASTSITATVVNYGSSKASLTIHPLLVVEEAADEYSAVAYAANPNLVSVDANSSAEVSFTGSLSSQIPAGEYILCFCIEDGEYFNILNDIDNNEAYYTVTVTSDGSITCSGITAPSSANIGQTMTVRATIASSYNQTMVCPIGAYICTRDEGGYIAEQLLGSKNLSVRGGSTMTFSVSKVVDSTLAPGSNYYLAIVFNGSTVLAAQPLTLLDPTGGVEDLMADPVSGTQKWYDLQGRDVKNVGSGLFIRKSSEGVQKILVK